MLTTLSLVLGVCLTATATLVVILSRRRRLIKNLRGPPSEFIFGTFIALCYCWSFQSVLQETCANFHTKKTWATLILLGRTSMEGFGVLVVPSVYVTAYFSWVYQVIDCYTGRHPYGS